MPSATKSQLLATATLHDRILAAQARFGVRGEDAKRHMADAKKLRKAAQAKR